MRLAAIALVVLVAAGCISYHNVRTEKTSAEVVGEQERRIAELERQIESLRKEYVAAVEELNALRSRPTGPILEPKVPEIPAKVTAIDTAENVITLSAGSADGVRPGYEFTIYVGDRYVGKIEVELVREDWCQGFSKKELQAKPIEVGQDARTRW